MKEVLETEIVFPMLILSINPFQRGYSCRKTTIRMATAHAWGSGSLCNCVMAPVAVRTVDLWVARRDRDGLVFGAVLVPGCVESD